MLGLLGAACAAYRILLVRSWRTSASGTAPRPRMPLLPWSPDLSMRSESLGKKQGHKETHLGLVSRGTQGEYKSYYEDSSSETARSRNYDEKTLKRDFLDWQRSNIPDYH